MKQLFLVLGLLFSLSSFASDSSNQQEYIDALEHHILQVGHSDQLPGWVCFAQVGSRGIQVEELTRILAVKRFVRTCKEEWGDHTICQESQFECEPRY